jgi:hypothetical protein
MGLPALIGLDLREALVHPVDTVTAVDHFVSFGAPPSRVCSPAFLLRSPKLQEERRR